MKKKKLSNVFADVAAKVNPSVVTIFTETDVKVEGSPFSGSPFEEFFSSDDLFKKFFQQQAPERNYKRMGLGSGVIVESDGLLLTNNHVVDEAEKIYCSFSGVVQPNFLWLLQCQRNKLDPV